MARAFAALGLLLLAGCGGGGWVKTGADEATTAADYRDCQSVTAIATKTDADIDQDIGATRGADLQRSEFLRGQARETHDSNRERAGKILSACMEAKGYSRKTGKFRLF